MVFRMTHAHPGIIVIARAQRALQQLERSNQQPFEYKAVSFAPFLLCVCRDTCAGYIIRVAVILYGAVHYMSQISYLRSISCYRSWDRRNRCGDPLDWKSFYCCCCCHLKHQNKAESVNHPWVPDRDMISYRCIVVITDNRTQGFVLLMMLWLC